MSRPLAPSGSRVPNVTTCPLASRPTMSVGRWIGLVALASRLAAGVDLIRLEQGVTDRVALGGEEREAHRPADGEGVDDVEQRLDDAELVADLGAPEHGDERPLRVRAQLQQHLDLALQQAPSGGRQERRRADDRGVGAVRRPEGVVDVAIRALDQLAHEGRIVGLLPGVEAQVLQQLDARRELGEAGRAPAPSSTPGRVHPSAVRGGWPSRRGRRAPAATAAWAGRPGSGSRR